MRSSELRARICLLRDDVEQLRLVLRRRRWDGVDRSLLRRVGRQAREVEAWGSELRDPCALATAHEAYQVLLRAEEAVAAPPTSKSLGAVVVLQCRHPAGLDPSRITGPLKAETLTAIVEASPCALDVAVGVLAMAPEDLLPVPDDPNAGAEGTWSSTIPLLVALRCPCTERPERLLECVHRAILDRRSEGDLCGPAAVSVATIPVPHGVLGYLVCRCEGGLLSASRC